MSNLKKRVLALIETHPRVGWAQFLSELIEDLEVRLEAAKQEDEEGKDGN